MTAPFVANLDLKMADKLLKDLKDQGFELSVPEHTKFAAKKKGISCTLYTSGKLVVQGKETQEFIEFYLEPEILKTFTFAHPIIQEIETSPRIGIDESGKGDFFGPLCIAGVYVDSEQFSLLKDCGVKDSKTLGDAAIVKIAKKIKATCLYHIVRINPPKYNEIYANFKNLNQLLAWGHATTIEHMVDKSGCKDVIIDQFANEWVVINALKRKNMRVNLTQRHRGEEDLAVAAASILAREAFLDGLAKLGRELDLVLPKGSTSTAIEAGRKVLSRYGVEALKNLCKQHFKTLDAILKKG